MNDITDTYGHPEDTSILGCDTVLLGQQPAAGSQNHTAFIYKAKEEDEGNFWKLLFTLHLFHY